MSVKMATLTTKSDVSGDLRRRMNPFHARPSSPQPQQPIFLKAGAVDVDDVVFSN
jgi:hypothetical protein